MFYRTGGNPTLTQTPTLNNHLPSSLKPSLNIPKHSFGLVRTSQNVHVLTSIQKKTSEINFLLHTVCSLFPSEFSQTLISACLFSPWARLEF